MNTYFLCATQPENLGDLLINKMLVDELCRFGNVYVDACGLPEFFKSPILSNKNVVDINKCCGFSLKHYHLVQAYNFIKNNGIGLYVNSPGPVYNLGSMRLWAFRLMHNIVKRAGSRVYNIGNCCSSAYLEKRSIPDIGVEKYYLRSEKSVAYMDSQQPKKSEYIPDLAVLLKYYVKTKDKDKSKTCALSFRPVKTNVNEFYNKCSSLICRIIDAGFKVVLYYQVESDKSFMFHMYDMVQSEGVSIKREQLRYNDIDFYADKNMVISNRLHCLLVGAVYGTIPIAMESQSSKCAKIEHVFNSIFGLDNKFVVSDQLDFNFFVDNEEELRKEVNNSMTLSANLCRETISNVIHGLELGDSL